MILTKATRNNSALRECRVAFRRLDPIPLTAEGPRNFGFSRLNAVILLKQ
jgi:hypothetical protein